MTLFLGGGLLEPRLARLSGTHSPCELSLGIRQTVLEKVLETSSSKTNYLFVGQNWTEDLSQITEWIPSLELLTSQGPTNSIGSSITHALREIGRDCPMELRWADSWVSWQPRRDSIAVSNLTWDPRWDYVSKSEPT